MELTYKYITKLVVDKRSEVPDHSSRSGKPRKGLMLQQNPSGNHVFLYRRMVKGERYGATLGAFPDVSLAEARELVDDINDNPKGIQAGIDAFKQASIPEEVRAAKAAANVITVKRLINQYIEEECEPHNRDWRNQKMVLERELKPHWELPANELSEDAVLAIVQACCDRNAPSTAQESVKQIKGMYNWALGKKRSRNPLQDRSGRMKVKIRNKIIKGITVNPAAHVVAPRYAPRTYHLEGNALNRFLTRLAASDVRADCKQILTIQLQTFSRVGEVCGMRWDELDLAKRLWTIPAERYKTGQEHVVCLSSQTVTLLKQIKKDCKSQVHVFPMPRDGYQHKPLDSREVAHRINYARASMKQHKDFTSHSLRHTGATWLASQLCPPDVRELLMGHKIDTESDMSKRYQHYKFMDERKGWTQNWCDFLEVK